mmetsp:Transcript_30790/g.42142  ORF Transcript_30790/g.42142 Transcript_30790/m.42142 type:complete len:927 (-) Transcript_30790:291-3071(-)
MNPPCYRGNHCFFNVSSTIEYSFNTVSVICANSTQWGVCSAGYYCPSPHDSVSCPVGSFCPMGVSKYIPCAFTSTTCPTTGMSNPNKRILLVILLVVVFGAFAIYRFLVRCVLFFEDNYRQSQEIRSIKNKAPSQLDEMLFSVKKRISFSAQLFHLFNTMIVSTSPAYLREDHNSSLLHDEHAQNLRFLHKRHNHHLQTFKPNSPKQHHDLWFSLFQKMNAEYRIEDRNNSASVHSKTNDEVEELVPDLESSNLSYLQSSSTSPVASVGIFNAETNTNPTLKEERPMDTSDIPFNFENVSEPMTISFKGLNLFLKTNQQKLLTNISGVVKHHEITALMGPSGAGKTTLLSLLMGTAHYAHVTGALNVNNRKVESLVEYRNCMAFVPQDDIMYDDLTVDDNIKYAAVLFNKRGYNTMKEVMPMVDAIEEMLGITFIRSKIVGNAERRGISGGQKKRVSIAIELVKESSLFFLDEPTSGLDAATSVSVVHTLHNLVHLGMNVVATLHQPRQEILTLMHKLILLGPGGRIVYCGPVLKLADHFSKLGYNCESGTNIADFALDVLHGVVIHKGDLSVLSVEQIIQKVTKFWDENGRIESESAIDQEETTSTNQEHKFKTKAKSQASFFTTLQFVCRRQFKVSTRCLDNILLACVAQFVLAVLIGNVFGSVQIDMGGSFSLQPACGQLVFMLLVQAMAANDFKFDKLMRIREESAGIHSLPYYIGKVIGLITELCFFSFAFNAGYYPFIQTRVTFLNYWYLYVLLHAAIMGFVNFIIILADGMNADLTAVGALVLLWAFGGMVQTYSSIIDSLGQFGMLLNYISPFKWSMELQILLEMRTYEAPLWPIDKVFKQYSYDANHESTDALGLVLYFIIANVGGYALLEWRRDNYKIWRTVMAPIEAELQRYYHKMETAIESISFKQTAKIEPEK